MPKTLIRLGDGDLVEYSDAELLKDIWQGTEEIAENQGIEPLSEDEVEYLFKLHTSKNRVTGVEKGSEVVLTYDGPTSEIRRVGINAGRLDALQIFERCFGSDTVEMSHVDYSYKPVKPIIQDEIPLLEQAQFLLIVPLFYGAMPNLGLYTRPDGPVPNPAELLPLGKIQEARQAYEEAIEYAVQDMVYIGSVLYEAGADGINFDTVGASGDPDFKAALLATEKLKAKYPDMCIEMGMAGEFVLGMHGDIEHNGRRLAGLFAQDQVKLAQESGVNLFGPVINTVSRKSVPWNLSRAITLTRACVQEARIPVHGNMGMGVGGIPVCEILPTDTVSLASKAMVELTRLDGL